MGTVALIDWTGGGLRNSDIASGAGIAASKVKHQRTKVVELAEQATEIAAIQKLIHIQYGATATLLNFEAASVAAGATSGTVTIDLHKSTGGGAFATILTTTITIEYDDTVLVPQAAVISNAAIVDGDILKVVVTIAGGGTYPDGLVAALTLWEDPA